MGASLCRLYASDIFVARAVFDLDASHVFPQRMLALSPLIGSVTGIVVSRDCTAVLDRASSLLCGCHSPVRGGVCSPVLGLEALRSRFYKALLPLNACLLCPKGCDQ